jgi:hypothetical protein
MDMSEAPTDGSLEMIGRFSSRKRLSLLVQVSYKKAVDEYAPSA